VQRLRLQYAKRGRLRFVSQRDFARALERALRRAGVPMAYSAGFTPHPKISYVSAAPTGVASEAEYAEIGLAGAVDPDALHAALDAALPGGLDIVAVTVAAAESLTDRIQAAHWRVELPGVVVDDARAAVRAFLDCEECSVERVTKSGRKQVDVRSPVISCAVSDAADEPDARTHAILDVVVRQVTPAVRPDDVLAALRSVAGFALAAPPIAVRVAQGPLDGRGGVGDPLAADGHAAQPSP
jgi:radical SAM-linked protein